MNAENLKKLKNNTKDTSILYVEDSLALQKQLSSFLGNVFDRFFQAFDGEKGLELFQKEDPDIIITDITMPNKTGLSMIEDMKKINPEVNVIVLTAHHDHETLFKTMNLGVANFLSKPLNIDKLIEILLEDIEMISKMQKIKCLKDLSIIKNHNASIEFFNTYKGIPIQDQGTVSDLSDDIITFKLPLKQLAIMNKQGFTMFKIPQSKKFIKASVESCDMKNQEITVSKPRYINFKTRSNAHKRIKVDKSFQLTLHLNDQSFKTHPYDASFVAVGLALEEINFEINPDDEISALIEFKTPVFDKNGSLLTRKSHNFFCQCDLLRLNTSASGTVLALKINLEKQDKAVYDKYLYSMEENIINELQTLVKKTN